MSLFSIELNGDAVWNVTGTSLATCPITYPDPDIGMTACFTLVLTIKFAVLSYDPFQGARLIQKNGFT